MLSFVAWLKPRKRIDRFNRTKLKTQNSHPKKQLASHPKKQLAYIEILKQRHYNRLIAVDFFEKYCIELRQDSATFISRVRTF